MKDLPGPFLLSLCDLESRVHERSSKFIAVESRLIAATSAGGDVINGLFSTSKKLLPFSLPSFMPLPVSTLAA